MGKSFFKRSQQIGVRFTDEEKATLEKFAHKIGAHSVSDWARGVLLAECAPGVRVRLRNPAPIPSKEETKRQAKADADEHNAFYQRGVDAGHKVGYQKGLEAGKKDAGQTAKRRRRA